jgi:hypothetical protein
MEAAIRHIEEARKFSAELGGIDQDVKDYFFSLSSTQLSPILAAYARAHGDDARSYAEQTLPKWKTGRTKMSGMVAERLFNLLPPRMPLHTKFELVKSLWEHVAPRTQKWFLIGPDATPGVILEKVRDYLVATVTEHTIPEAMRMRFKWLAAGDVTIEEELLNYLRQVQRDAALSVTGAELDIMLRQIQSEAEITKHLSRTIKLGKHECHLLFDAKETGVTARDSRPYSGGSAADWSWLWWVALVGFIILMMAK